MSWLSLFRKNKNDFGKPSTPPPGPPPPIPSERLGKVRLNEYLIRSILVVDVETGGLDPSVNPLLEVAIAPLDAHGFSGGHQCRWFGCGLPCDPVALEVNGLDPDEGVSPAIAAERFDKHLDHLAEVRGVGRFILAGMNPAFDRDFLRVNLVRHGIKPRFSHRTIDLHSLAVAYALANGESIESLHTDGIYEMLGLPPERKPHRAMEGVFREREAFKILLDF